MGILGNGCQNKALKLTIYAAATLLTSCIYFGWQDYSKMLIRSGAYSWLCPPDTAEGETCTEQDNAISRLYAFANGSEFAFAFVAGVLLDWIGPRQTALVGELLHALGFLLLILSKESCQMYIPALFISGMCVNIVAFPALTVVETWPTRQALIVSLIVGFQSTASVIAPVLRTMWDKHPDWTFQGVWGCWLAAIWLPVTLLYLWALPPKRNFALLAAEDLSIAREEQSISRSDSTLSGISVASSEDDAFTAPLEPVPDHEHPANHMELEQTALELQQQKSISSQMPDKEKWQRYWKDVRTIDLAVMAVFFFLLMFQFAYYPAVVRSAVSEHMSNFVGWITPLQGPFSLVIGFFMDYTGTVSILYIMCFTLLFVNLSTGFGAARENLMYVVAVWFVFIQSATYNVKYTFVGEMYDPYNFGKLVGTIGIFGGIGVYASAPMTSNENYRLMFGILASLSLLMMLFSFFLNMRQVKGHNHKTVKGIEQTHRIKWNKKKKGLEIKQMDEADIPTNAV